MNKPFDWETVPIDRFIWAYELLISMEADDEITPVELRDDIPPFVD